jgi:putative membrane protein
MPSRRNRCKGLFMSTNTALDSVSNELSSRRTGMSFQRTRLSAERTLMSVIRTSLSLIGFGFTIFQFFQKLRQSGELSGEHAHAPRNFGVTLVFLGVTILALGILYHARFMMGLRDERKAMAASGLIHAESAYPVSFTLLIAVLVLGIGLLTLLSVMFNAGPFS